MRFEGRAVYKPTQVESIDDFFTGDDAQLREAYTYALDLLGRTEGQSLAETTADLASGSGPGPTFEDGDVRHFRDHWLGEDAPLPGDDVDRVMRQGYTEAIRVALEHEPPLPLETLWVTGSGDDYEIYICEGSTRVTLLAFIPPGAADEGAREAASASRSRSWVIRVDRGDEQSATTLDAGDAPVVKVQLSGPAASAD